MKTPFRFLTPSRFHRAAIVTLLTASVAACSSVETLRTSSINAADAEVKAVRETATSLAGTAPRSEPSKEPNTLLDVLLANGSLTLAEYEALAKPQPPAPTAEDEPSFTIDAKGLRFKSADGESSMKVGGRVQVDGNFHSREVGINGDTQDGTELRRGRFEMKGRLPENLIWAAEVDFGNDGSDVKDFWLGLDPESGPSWVVGHQKQPFSLGVEMSSNDIPFVERGIDNFLIIPFVDRAIGIRAQDNTDNVFWAAGIFGESVQPTSVDDEGWGAVARVVGTPIHEDGQVLHLAARGAYRMPEDGSNSVRIRDESTNMSNLRIVDTGVITDVDAVSMYGVEATYVHGPFSIGGELNQLQVDRTGGDFDFSSWHVQATYSLTGESREDAYRIDSGEFKRLSAAEGERAWELAARFATIDLNDNGLSGGAEDALSLALNWYYNPTLRFMLGWTNVLDTEGGSATTSDADGVNIFTIRAQLTF